MSKNNSPYHHAGWIINEHLQNRRSLKSIAFDTHNNGKGRGGAPDKATYATVCKTVQHLSAINEVLDANKKRLRKAIGFDSVRNTGLLYVMLYELLFGKYKSMRGGGKIKRMIAKHERELRREAEDYIAKHGNVGGSSNGGNVVVLPRYIRVNTLRSSVSEIIGKLKEDLLKADELSSTNDGIGGIIYADANVPDLLVLPPDASSWLHSGYEPIKSGKIVLQDKSSCFSALALAHGLSDKANEGNSESFDFIDACAAPGNKTSHLAALVYSSLGEDTNQSKKKKKGKQNKPKSTIYAFERSSSRFNVLQERMEQLVSSPFGNGNKVVVIPIHGDFLKVDPSDPKFANVRSIMLDPSCSGSGIVNSPDRSRLEADGISKDLNRIKSLSNFQLIALKHAMSFPNVDRIVYSTCSVHEEENELVVSKALLEVNESENGDGWELIAPTCLVHWPRRGREGGIGGLTKSQADCLVRCDGLDGDNTNGFFVSFFVRTGLASGSRNARKATEFGSMNIPIYNGQFANGCRKSFEPRESENHVHPSRHQKQQQTQAETKDIPQLSKATNKSAKKREKKLAWKRKQALQKSQRILKKVKTAKESK